MSNTNVSVFFDAIEQFVYINPRKCSVAAMNKIAKNRGCADILIDQVINGVIVDFIMNIIAPQNVETKVMDAKRNEIPDNRINPTYQELMDILTKEKFSDLPIDRAEKIVGYLVQKSVLTIDDKGLLYKSKSLLPHQTILL